MSALRSSVAEARGKALVGLRRHACADDEPVFLEPRHLSPEAVKLGVGRENTDGAVQRKARENSVEKCLSVGRDRDAARIGEIKYRGDPALQRRQQLAEHELPFVTGEPRGVLPALHLRIEGDVGPFVVAVGRKVDALRVRGAEAGEVGAQIEHRIIPFRRLIARSHGGHPVLA